MKPFPEKRMNGFTRNKQTIEFINGIHADKEKTLISAFADSEIVIVKRGRDGGTWMHEDLAIEFARWLSPKFRLWCSRRNQKILNQGYSAAIEEGTVYIDEQIRALPVINEISD